MLIHYDSFDKCVLNRVFIQRAIARCSETSGFLDAS